MHTKSCRTMGKIREKRGNKHEVCRGEKGSVEKVNLLSLAKWNVCVKFSKRSDFLNLLSCIERVKKYLIGFELLFNLPNHDKTLLLTLAAKLWTIPE